MGTSFFLVWHSSNFLSDLIHIIYTVVGYFTCIALPWTYQLPDSMPKYLLCHDLESLVWIFCHLVMCTGLKPINWFTSLTAEAKGSFAAQAAVIASILVFQIIIP